MTRPWLPPPLVDKHWHLANSPSPLACQRSLRMPPIIKNNWDWCSMGVPNTGMRKNLTCYNGIQKSIWLDAIMAQFYARFFSNYFHNILFNFLSTIFFLIFCTIFSRSLLNFWDNVCPILFLFCLKIDSSGRTIVDF